jgi:hypothetical protein
MKDILILIKGAYPGLQRIHHTAQAKAILLFIQDPGETTLTEKEMKRLHIRHGKLTIMTK